MSNLKKVFSSSFLLSSEAILRKLVGVISTLIIARLLVPDDFGLIAIALLVMGFMDSMQQFGSDTYLLKSEKINDDMINTAWTIGFSSNLFLASMLAIATPYIADYYSDPRLEAVIWAFTGIWVMRSLGNPALVMLKREQTYLPIVKLSIITKIMAVIVVIISAFIFESYWALVLGQFTTYLLTTIGGYFLYHFSPRFCLSGFKEQWQFSSWWILQSFIGFFKGHLDTFLVSSMFDKAALGSYHTIKYFSSMPTTFLLQPATKPLLVELRKLKENKSYFSQQFNVALIVALCFAVPISLFLVQEHFLVTATLLGDNWTAYSELFSIFCISIITYVIQKQASDVLVVFGLSKGIFYFQLLSFIVVYGVLLCFGSSSINGFAEIKVWMEAIVVLGLFLYVTLRYTSFNSIINFIVALTPIILASITSIYLDIQINSSYPVLVQLVLTTINFFAIYAVVLFSCAFVLKTSNPEWRYIWRLSQNVISSIVVKVKDV